MNERTWQIISAVLIAFILGLFGWIGVSAEDYVNKRIDARLEAPEDARGELKTAILELQGTVNTVLAEVENNKENMSQLEGRVDRGFERVIDLLERRSG